MAEDPYMVVVNQEAERGRARGQGPGAKCMSSSSAFPSSSFFLKLNLFYFMCMDVFLICMSLHHVHACPHGCHKRVPGLL